MGFISIAQNQRYKKQASLRHRAFADAKLIARILSKKFGARKVILYGSLAREHGHFDRASDIDLAVEGLGARYFRAYGYCLQAARFNLDIKPYEDMPEYFRDKIGKEGRLLYERK